MKTPSVSHRSVQQGTKLCILEAQGNRCFAGLNEQEQILNTVREAVKEISDDLFEEQTSASRKFESVEDRVSTFDSKVHSQASFFYHVFKVVEFERTQQSLSSSVSNFRQDVEISIAGYLNSFNQYIGMLRNHSVFILDSRPSGANSIKPLASNNLESFYFSLYHFLPLLDKFLHVLKT